MKNGYFQPGAARGERVRDLFENIAGRYDLVNDLQSFGLHRRWKRRVADITGAKPGANALDVCCGTGDIASALARRGAAVTGLDFSESMLGVAQDRISKAGLKINFMQGDAQALPFPDRSFDIVTVGYGLRNLAEWNKGLAEMVRVARPGGRIVVLDFGKPPNGAWRALYFTYLRTAVPLFGKVFCKNSPAYAYIMESLQHYPAQEGVRLEMAALNLGNVRVELLLGGVMAINSGVA